MNLDNIFGCVFSVGGLWQEIRIAAIESALFQGQSVFRHRQEPVKRQKRFEGPTPGVRESDLR